MYQEREKTSVEMNDAPVKMVSDTLKIGVYTVYDCVLKQYDIPIAIPQNKLYDYMKLLVNDVNSKYFEHEADYILNKVGDFNVDTGEIEQHFIERVSTLDKYVDNEKRKLQTIIQVLNYLPSGYFKMPLEQKQVIQEKIDNAINDYVAQYVIPDLDISKFDTNKIRDIYQNYDTYKNCSYDSLDGSVISKAIINDD